MVTVRFQVDGREFAQLVLHLVYHIHQPAIVQVVVKNYPENLHKGFVRVNTQHVTRVSANYCYKTS